MPQRRKPSDMRLMSIEQQLEVQQRLANRREASEAVKRLEAAFKEFLDNDEALFKRFIAKFQAKGYAGQYHENPNDTVRRRQLATQVKQLLRETPLNWMGAIELSYNVMRMNNITEFLRGLAPGSLPIDEILNIYESVGDDIRKLIVTETGHLPEEFPYPRDRITGNESDDLFKVTEHQPKLFE